MMVLTLGETRRRDVSATTRIMIARVASSRAFASSRLAGHQEKNA
jgi:hypothetical protein